jgi:hypothetical protein
MNRRVAWVALLSAAATVALAGGGLSYEYRAYKGKVPFSETALIFAVDDRNMNFRNSNILKVDGKGTGMMGPMRTSARVLPGTHTFTIRAIWDFSGAISGSTTGVTTSSSFRERELEIEVKDMQPLHVYVIRYRFEDEQISLTVDDLGERATYHPYALTRAAAF